MTQQSCAHGQRDPLHVGLAIKEIENALMAERLAHASRGESVTSPMKCQAIDLAQN